MKNFNSILSIILPGLVKYENVVNKIYINVDATLKQYNNNEHTKYNKNNLIILDKLKYIEDIISQPREDTESIIYILRVLNDIYMIKNLIHANFDIVTLQSILHTIKNEFSETKTVNIDKKILTATNVMNSINISEYAFINEFVYLFIKYFNEHNIYIDSLLVSELSEYNNEYLNKVIIGIINFYKYNPEYIDRNKQITRLLYKSIYDSILSDNIISDDIWYIPIKCSSNANEVIYKLENLLIPIIPALHVVNGISNNIVTRFNTIIITPPLGADSKYKIMRDYKNIYMKNYLREKLMNTMNIKFPDIIGITKKYDEWKEDNEDNILLPTVLTQILAKNFSKLLQDTSRPGDMLQIKSFSDFSNLISGIDTSNTTGARGPIEPIRQNNMMVYNTYIVQSFSDFYFENVSRLISTQFTSGHTNSLFDDQASCDENFMKEAYISNLINIKASAMTLQKKIIDAVNTTFKSEVYSILSYKNSRTNDAWLTLFKTIIKSIIDPGKNIKSKFVEKNNILIPKASLKHFIMKNSSIVFKLNI